MSSYVFQQVGWHICYTLLLFIPDLLYNLQFLVDLQNPPPNYFHCHPYVKDEPLISLFRSTQESLFFCLMLGCWATSSSVSNNKLPVSNQRYLSLSRLSGSSLWQMHYYKPLRVWPEDVNADCASASVHSPPWLWGCPGGQGCPWSGPISGQSEPCQ